MERRGVVERRRNIVNTLMIRGTVCAVIGEEWKGPLLLDAFDRDLKTQITLLTVSRMKGSKRCH